MIIMIISPFLFYFGIGEWEIGTVPFSHSPIPKQTLKLEARYFPLPTSFVYYSMGY